MKYWKDLFIGQTLTVIPHYAIVGTDKGEIFSIKKATREILLTEVNYYITDYFRLDFRFIDSNGNLSIKHRSYNHLLGFYCEQVLGRKMHKNNRWIIPAVGDYINSFESKKLPKEPIKELHSELENYVKFEGKTRFTKLRVDQFIIPYPELLEIEPK